MRESTNHQKRVSWARRSERAKQQATAQHLTCLPESGARCSSASPNPRSSPTAADNRMPSPASIVIYQMREKERGREMCEQSIAVRGYNRQRDDDDDDDESEPA